MTALDLRFTREHESGSISLGHSGTFFRSPRSFFAELVGLAHNATQELVAMQAREHEGRPAFLLGSLERPAVPKFSRLVSRFDGLQRPVSRDVRSDGSVRSHRWLASEVLGDPWDHAVTVVEFDAGVNDVTLLAYEHSERLVIVLEGSGVLYTSSATLDEVAKKGFGTIGTHVLHAGSAVILTRGIVHGFAGHAEKPLRLVVCHVPYVDPADDRYSTIAKWLAIASIRDILDVFEDRDLLTTLYLVCEGVRTTPDLCRLMHRDREAMESFGQRLEAIRMVTRDAAGGWLPHPTVSMSERDSRIEITREERGYRVSQRFRRKT
ncbi:MAG: hypothetical protein H6716_26795 [Polyangiaceae bacterium]|nr:hypothetical protein [Polyangiaceae bacterium]